MPTTNKGAEKKPTSALHQRYLDVKDRMAAAARRSGRNADDIILVAVTKNASMDQIRELIELGHVDFGENRVQNLVQRAAQVQEFLERHRVMGDERPRHLPEQVRWHMIGHLQRNKVRKLMGRVRLIHSIDSLRLVESIQTAAVKLEEPVEILIQVNSANERAKQGIAPAATRHVVEQIDTMMNLRPRGLMCIGPLTEDRDVLRRAFVLCKEVFDDIRRCGSGGERFDILSMGMTNDYELAIECGSNIVRVGTAIFGPPAEDSEPE